MQQFGASPQEPVLTEAAGAALQRISNFSFWCDAAWAAVSMCRALYGGCSGDLAWRRLSWGL